MNAAQYQKAVLRTESPPTPELISRLVNQPRLLHANMGIETEAGEFCDDLKRHLFYGEPLDKDNLKQELGDLMWYIGLACNVLDIKLSDVMEANILKLKKRFPEKFSNHKALNRDIKAEQEAINSV